MIQGGIRYRWARYLARARICPPLWRDPRTWGMALIYHRFTHGDVRSPYQEVSCQTFRAQLQTLCRHFAPRPLRPTIDVLLRDGQHDADRPALFFTVDDGDRSLLDVLGDLEAAQVPVALFIPVGLLLGPEHPDGLRSWLLRYYRELQPAPETLSLPADPSLFFELVHDSGEPQLSKLYQQLRRAPRTPDPLTEYGLFTVRELEDLARHELVTIGSHSMSHQPMALLPEAWRRWEIAAAQQHLRELSGDPELFSLPYGDLPTSAWRADLDELGVRYVFTLQCRRIDANRDSYTLGRTGLFESPDRHYVLGAAGGAYELWDQFMATGARAWPKRLGTPPWLR